PPSLSIDDYGWTQRVTPSPLKLTKQLWSSIIQLKLGHGYFRSYLVRLPAYNSGTCNLCQTNQEQTPYHLLFHCPAYRDIRYRAFSRVDRKDYNLFYLFSKDGQESLVEFLKETKIATRKWHIGTNDYARTLLPSLTHRTRLTRHRLSNHAY
ncbi:hypothetical protein T310_9703, partial [Rasamsonia emersonii CBS 393.64]